MAKRKAVKRERVDTKVGGTRFVRRRQDGTFKESDQVGPSLKADRRKKNAKTKVKSGQGIAETADVDEARLSVLGLVPAFPDFVGA